MLNGTPASAQNPRTTLRWMLLSIAVPALIGAIFGVLVPGLTLWRYYQAGHWQPTTCTIERVSYYRDRSTRGSYVDYVPDIDFSYDLAGIHHVASTPSLSKVSFYERASLNHWLANFPQGSAKPCPVNPADTAQAVLVRNWSWGTPILLFFVLAFEVTLIVLMLFPIRRLRALKRDPAG